MVFAEGCGVGFAGDVELAGASSVGGDVGAVGGGAGCGGRQVMGGGIGV